MTVKPLLALALGWCVVAAPAFAAGDEIVVTAQRYVDRFEDAEPPQIGLTRRADNVVAVVAVESDTRDFATRRAELQEALREIDRRSRSGGEVAAAILEDADDESAGETRVKPFSLAAALAGIASGARQDTSRVAILLRTGVRPDDTIEAAEARLEKFLSGVPKPGRVTMQMGALDLTIIEPSQYRAPIIEAIAADGRKALAALGPGHGMRLSGLERRVAWRRSSDLELTLFIPHKIEFVPLGD